MLAPIFVEGQAPLQMNTAAVSTRDGKFVALRIIIVGYQRANERTR